jgi:CO/xanthine dehydrogenase Mo-binding subunit
MACVAHVCAQVLLRAGAYLDLASNDGAQLLAASDSAYDLSGLHVSVKFARCNLPPHTIVRGPGYLQGVMVLEQVRLLRSKRVQLLTSTQGSNFWGQHGLQGCLLCLLVASMRAL